MRQFQIHFTCTGIHFFSNIVSKWFHLVSTSTLVATPNFFQVLPYQNIDGMFCSYSVPSITMLRVFMDNVMRKVKLAETGGESQ